MNKIQMQLEEAALYDDNMGLPNFHQLKIDVQDIIRTGKPVFFVCFDISSGRKVRYAYGREAEENLTSEVARWFSHFPRCDLYRAVDSVYCLVLRDQSLEEAKLITQEIIHRFDVPWRIWSGDSKITLYAELSIALISGDIDAVLQEDLEDYFLRSLDSARTEGKACAHGTPVDQIARERFRMQMHLKKCVSQGMKGFEISYQSIADPISGVWCALEALSGWDSPVFGTVSPGEFIPELERLDMMRDLTEWIIETSIRQCKKAALDELEGFFLTVSVPIQELEKYSFVEYLRDVLAQASYPGNKLMLEITGNNSRYAYDMMRRGMEELRALGVQFILGDFETRQDGVQILEKLPVQCIRTGKRLAENIERDHYLQCMLYAMAEIAHGRDMRLIAGGVETQRQLQCVMKNGVDMVQGHYYGKPFRAKELEKASKYFFTPVEKNVRGQKITGISSRLRGAQGPPLTPGIFGLMDKCIRVALHEEGEGESFDRLLSAIGNHFRVHRVFVFTRDEGTVYSNRYEWCAPGVTQHRELFQGVDIALGGLYDDLLYQGAVMASEFEQFPADLQALYRSKESEASVQSIAVLPTICRGEIIGFVGFNDARRREWTSEEMILLRNLCLLALLIMNKKV